MSGLDSLPLDAEGYLDLDQLPADVLDDAAVAELHDALVSDPVDEPTDDDWALLLDDVVDGDADALDLSPFDVDGDVAAVAYDADVDVADAEVDADLDVPDVDADLDVDTDLDVIGLDLDDDLVDPTGGAYDQDLGADVDADAPAEISHDFEDLL